MRTVIEAKEVEKKVYAFEEHELKVILDCVLYSRHRYKTASDAGIKNVVTLERIESLIREIKEQKR